MANYDSVEFAEPKYSTCECCGAKTTRLTRYVSREEVAFAVYLAVFSSGHDYVSVLASFGGWGGAEDEFGPADRTAFAFRISANEQDYQVGLVDRCESGFETDYFGVILDRIEALQHPLCQEVFDLSDHILQCDQLVIEFFNKVPR